jgi:hypothetical protein
MAIGAADWTIGLARSQHFVHLLAGTRRIDAEKAYRHFEELDAGAGSAVLAPLSAEQKRVSYATARLDFYHAMLWAGEGMVLAGLFFALVGLGLRLRTERRNFYNARASRKRGTT